MHGSGHHDRQRLITQAMLWSSLIQTFLWTLLLIGAFSVPSLRVLFQKVFWVSILSLYANWATALSIVAGSWSALAAGRAHEDAEATASTLHVDLATIDRDLARLADLEPGPEAQNLARGIRQQLGRETRPDAAGI